MKKTSILFVCLGNICRSPIAEAVMRAKVKAAGIEEDVIIDSAGTGNWHIGKAPDPRMIKAGAERGYDLNALRARQVRSLDFQEFDYILAMDEENLTDLEDLSPHTARAHVALFLTYANGLTEREVPDPYFGGDQGFYHVIDLVEAAADGLLKSLTVPSA